MVTVTQGGIIVSKTKSNIFQHVVIVEVLVVKIFVFMTVVLTKFNLTHTGRRNKNLSIKKLAAILFSILVI